MPYPYQISNDGETCVGSGSGSEVLDQSQREVRAALPPLTIPESKETPLVLRGSLSDAKDNLSPRPVRWKKTQGIGALSFTPCGARLIGGNLEQIIPPPGSDFALVKVDKGPALLNTYQLDDEERMSASAQVVLCGSMPDQYLLSGPILILVGPKDVRKGYVLEGTSIFAVKGTVFKTRKVELSEPLGMSFHLIKNSH